MLTKILLLSNASQKTNLSYCYHNNSFYCPNEKPRTCDSISKYYKCGQGLVLIGQWSFVNNSWELNKKFAMNTKKQALEMIVRNFLISKNLVLYILIIDWIFLDYITSIFFISQYILAKYTKEILLVMDWKTLKHQIQIVKERIGGNNGAITSVTSNRSESKVFLTNSCFHSMSGGQFLKYIFWPKLTYIFSYW